MSEQFWSKLLKAALPHWLTHYEQAHGALSASVRTPLLCISPAQIDRLLKPVRVRHPRTGLCATQPGPLLRHQVPTRSGPPDTSLPGHIEADTGAHWGDTTAGSYVHSLTFTELHSGWTEIRAVWNKSSHAILAQLKSLEACVPFPMRSFHADNGSEFLNWPLYQHLTRRPLKVPFPRSRAYRKNDNAHCAPKNWTHLRQLFGHDRFEHPELVAWMNDLYGQEWSALTNHFRPTFKLLRRETRGRKTVRVYESQPKTPYQRLLENPEISATTQQALRAQHAQLNPILLKKRLETKLRMFFTAWGNLNYESTKV